MTTIGMPCDAEEGFNRRKVSEKEEEEEEPFYKRSAICASSRRERARKETWQKVLTRSSFEWHSRARKAWFILRMSRNANLRGEIFSSRVKENVELCEFLNLQTIYDYASREYFFATFMIFASLCFVKREERKGGYTIFGGGFFRVYFFQAQRNLLNGPWRLSPCDSYRWNRVTERAVKLIGASRCNV